MVVGNPVEFVVRPGDDAIKAHKSREDVHAGLLNVLQHLDEFSLVASQLDFLRRTRNEQK